MSELPATTMPAPRRGGLLAQPGEAFIYGVLLPSMSRLPTRWAYAAARWRGRRAERGKGDWVERALASRYIAQQTRQAWHDVFPSASDEQLAAWSRSRYEAWAEEELEACWIARDDRRLRTGLDVARAHATLATAAPGGLVLVQAHFNNPTLACLALGLATERPVWMTVSGVYEHPLVHPLVRALFRGKYGGAERTLHGGRLVHSEDATAMRQLYRALGRGEIVIVVADLPPEPGRDGIAVPWMGGERVLAAGAQRLAARTASQVGALWLACPRPGRWTLQVALSDAGEPDADIRQAYERLGRELMADPGRWWAAHLLQATPRSATAPAPAAAGG